MAKAFDKKSDKTKPKRMKGNDNLGKDVDDGERSNYSSPLTPSPSPEKKSSSKMEKMIKGTAVNVNNQYIIDEFEKLKKQIRFDIDNTKDRRDRMKHSFRLQAVDKVLSKLKKFPETIKSSSQLKGIEGIGKNSLERIDEIIETKKLSEISPELINQSYLDYIDELSSVFGIGEKLAYQLYRQHGIKSIEELKNMYELGKITLPEVVVKGLKYYGLAKEKIPRDEIIEIDTYLHDVLFNIDPELFGIICGSFRRMNPTSNDIDMLLIHPSVRTITAKYTLNENYLGKFVTTLRNEKFIVESFTDEEVITKYMGLCKWKNNPIRRIDIRFIPYDSYYTAILYFTGPKDFNRNMRKVAISLGFMLNEYALTDEENGLRVPINSEKDVFDVLGMEYLPPEKR